MTIRDFLASLPAKGYFDRPLDFIPYAAFLGLRLRRENDGQLMVTMGQGMHLVGQPFPPTIHGGAIGALLEIAGVIQAASLMSAAHLPKTVDITIDYLRPGSEGKDCHAAAEIRRMGRRFANVQVSAWQDDPAKPIALAHMNLLVAER
jgi:uncharacterized protein (TIGR00369 family)